jgi:hypothetical protein
LHLWVVLRITRFVAFLWRFAAGRYSEEPMPSTPSAAADGGRAFRIGRVKCYQRGRSWYLCYHENGQRRRPRVGTDRAGARVLAAQSNGQVEPGACAMLAVAGATRRQ